VADSEVGRGVSSAAGGGGGGGFLSATGDLEGGLPLVDCLSGTGTGGAPWLTRVLRGGWP
jgi:hypothetical protein